MVDTDHGVEFGDIEYVMSEFANAGVIYHFITKWNFQSKQPDHEHSFGAVLSAIADDPEYFSYKSFEHEYSEQQVQYIEAIFAKYREVGKRNI